MPEPIGLRELKNNASRILRSVREEMSEYVVTLRGEPVALLRPWTEEDARRLSQAELEQSLDEMKALARDVAAAWTSDKSGVELIDEQRR